MFAAAYILNEGNSNGVLCERGIYSFDDTARFTLNLGAIPAIKALSRLPVIIDPSHAAGNWERVLPIDRAAVVAGVDAMIVEVHSNSAFALYHGQQSLVPECFATMMTWGMRDVMARERPVAGTHASGIQK